MAARGQSDPLATRPGEPVNNLLTYALGLDLTAGGLSAVQPAFGPAGPEKTFSYQRRLGDPSLQYAVEWSPDGFTWSSAGAMVTEVSSIPGGDGTARVSLRVNAPLATDRRALLRVRVAAP
jgi:hypothetical protein